MFPPPLPPPHTIVIIAFVMLEIIETASFQIALFISQCSEVNRREVMPVWGQQEVMNTSMVLVGEGLG